VESPAADRAAEPERAISDRELTQLSTTRTKSLGIPAPACQATELSQPSGPPSRSTIIRKESILAQDSPPRSGEKPAPSAKAQASPTLPLVSVITSVLNCRECIADCIESVLQQDYPNIEHIILDGGSTDGTVGVLRTYEQNLTLWVSEPDAGPYEAWNKGLDRAQGDWIAFLGADDTYLPGAVRMYMELAREHPQAQFLSSKVKWLHASGYSKSFGDRWQWPRFSKFMCAAHPGSMHRRELFDRYGRYDPSYRSAGDYEFLLRPGPELLTAFMPVITVAMQAGGISNSPRALKEAMRAKVQSGQRSAGLAALEWQLAILKLSLRSSLLKMAQRLL